MDLSDPWGSQNVLNYTQMTCQLQAHVLFINAWGDDPQIVIIHADDITLWVLPLKRLKRLSNLIFLNALDH
jgi:hypothetical protein